MALKDASGNTLAQFTPAKQYSSVVISVPGLAQGSTYSLYSGDTQLAQITLSGTTTVVSSTGEAVSGGTTMGGGGMGGGPGGGRRG